MDHVIYGATLNRATLRGDGPFRVEVRLGKEADAETIALLRDAHKQAVAKAIADEGGAPSDWAADNIGFTGIEDGDALDQTKAWNRGNAGCVRVSATSRNRPFIVGADGHETSDVAARNAVSKPGALVNVGLTLSAKSASGDYSAAMFVNVSWIQYKGMSKLVAQEAQGGFRVAGAEVLENVEPPPAEATAKVELPPEDAGEQPEPPAVDPDDIEDEEVPF